MSATYPDGVLVRSNGETFIVVAGERQLISDEALLDEIDNPPAPRDAAPVVTPVLELDSGVVESIPRGPDFEARGVIEASREDEVRSDMPRRYMSSTVRLSQEAGRLDGDTRTWTRQPWIGFTAGICVLLTGPGGEIIHNTDVVRFGVDGFRIPFKRWDRADHWVMGVPADVARAATGLEIVHSHAPRSRINDIVAEAKQLGQAAVEVAAALRALLP